jgi:hypothetical protein
VPERTDGRERTKIFLTHVAQFTEWTQIFAQDLNRIGTRVAQACSLWKFVGARSIALRLTPTGCKPGHIEPSLITVAGMKKKFWKMIEEREKQEQARIS